MSKRATRNEIPFEYPCPPHCVGELVARGARLFGTRRAFAFVKDGREESRDYRAFAKETGALAAYFAHRGHPRVALIGPNRYEWILCYFAVMAAGGVVVPIDWQLSLEQATALTTRYRCDLAVDLRPVRDSSREISAQTLYAEDIQLLAAGEGEAPPKVDGEEAACVVSSSGTTGDVKGIVLTHQNLCAVVEGCAKSLSPSGTVLALLPLHHIYAAVISVLVVFACGGCVAISGQPSQLREDAMRFAPNYICVVPAVLEAVRRALEGEARKRGVRVKYALARGLDRMLRPLGVDLRRPLFRRFRDALGGRLTYFVCGGAALSAPCERFFDEIGIPVLNGYGMTETAGGICINRLGRIRPGSVGRPIFGVQMRVSGNLELLIKGDMVAQKYDDGTSTPHDGPWLRTGDLGRVDKDGYFYLTGRIKNLIILGNGENVSPEELEALLSRIPCVREVIVSGEGNALCAEFLPDFDELHARGLTDARAYLSAEVHKINRGLPPYKAIAIIRVRRSEFVKNTAHKIVRAADAGEPPASDAEAAICAAFSSALGGVDVSRGDSLFALGGDSLVALSAAEKLYDMGVQPQDLYRYATPAELARACAMRESAPSFCKEENINALISVRQEPDPSERILLTGASGYLGAHLLRRLLRDGKRVRCLVRDPQKLERVLKWYFPKEVVAPEMVVRGDITKERMGLTKTGYEELSAWTQAVVHAAANVRHAGSYEALALVNVTGTENVAAFCEKAGAALHHCSTIALSGFSPAFPLSEDVLDVGQSVSENPYLRAKYRAEELVLKARAAGLRASIYRVGNLCWRRDGVFQMNDEENGLLARQRALGTLRVYPACMADFEQDYTAVDECADALVRLMQARGTGYIWHLANPNTLSPRRFPCLRAVSDDAFDAACRKHCQSRAVTMLSMYVGMYRRGLRENAVCSKTVAALSQVGFCWTRPSPLSVLLHAPRVQRAKGKAATF